MDPEQQEREPPPAPSVRILPGRALDRDIWAMAWPAMLSFMLINIVDLVDVALVGRLGRSALAAYGYAAQYVSLVNTLIQAVGIGCVALAARAVGANNPGRTRRVLAGAFVVSQGIAWSAAAMALVAPVPLLELLNAEAVVIEMAVPYFRTVMISTVLYAGAFMFESVLRAHRLTRIPLAIMCAVTLVKAGLCYCLVYGAVGFPRLELQGAAVSTVVAHAIGFGLYVLVARKTERATSATLTFGKVDLLRGAAESYEVLRVSLPAMGERLVNSAALLTYFAILSRYGTSAIAAYAVGVRLLSFSWVPGLGFAAAASTFVGQALGAGDGAEARRSGGRAVRLAVLAMSGLGVVCLLLREPLSHVFTTDADVVRELVPFLTMLAVSLPFLGGHFTLAGVLRGAGDTVTPLVGAALGNWVFRVPLAWLYASVFKLSLSWVWSALVLDHVSRVLVNGFVFLRGRWWARVAIEGGEPPRGPR